MKFESKYLALAAIASATVALDQLIKLKVHSSFQLGESIPVIQNIFSLTYVRNTGAAFGILRESAPLFRQIFFLSMPPVALVIILFMLKGVPSKDRWQVLSLSLIFGGAIGNYIDRLRFGFVIDFLDVHYKDVYTYPAFNIADSAIVSGVAILLALMTIRDRRTKKEAAIAA